MSTTIGLKSALFIYAIVFNGAEFRDIDIHSPFVSEKRCMEAKDKINKRMEKVEKIGEWMVLDFKADCEMPSDDDDKT